MGLHCVCFCVSILDVEGANGWSLYVSFYLYQLGYEQFGISRKGAEDTSDQHCTIFYDKEKVFLPPKEPCFLL